MFGRAAREADMQKRKTPREPKQSRTDRTVAVRKNPGRLWRACSNLSNDGKKIAAPGDELVLSAALAEHYLKYAPGCIEEVSVLN